MKSNISLLSRFLRALSLMLALSFLINFMGCSHGNDKCEDIICQNSGTCANGVCNCPTGYLGSKCEMKANTGFAGNYTGQMTCDGSVNNESFPIEAVTDPSTVIIHVTSLHALTATVNENSITIPVQNFPSGSENYRYSGNGTLNDNNLSLTLYVLYSSNDPDLSYICTFTGNK